MDNLVEVKDDLFHIAKRLKEVDRNYELYFNRIRHRFEIYAKGALQIAVPFERLDVRTLDLARRTRIEYVEKLIASIEKDNEILEKRNLKKNCDIMMTALENML